MIKYSILLAEKSVIDKQKERYEEDNKFVEVFEKKHEAGKSLCC
jgi:hypothetical protein